MTYRCVIDEAIGETRAAIWAGKTQVELYTRRHSEADHPRRGDHFAGRVRRIEKSLGAAFIDLGREPDGFLKFTTAPNAPRLTEGLRIDVEISREAESGKGPVVKFLKSNPDAKPGRIKGQSLEDFIAARFPDTTFEYAKVNSLVEAIQTEISIPGGGMLIIERTKALTAIDIDSGNAPSPFAVAKAACPVIAHQLRLRGIGGLVAIDFPNLRQRRQREDIQQVLSEAFTNDPNTIKIAPLSRFGVIEMTRARIGRSLDEICLDRAGNLSAETQALESLRRLEQEGRVNPGAKLTMTLDRNVYDWLFSDKIDWITALTDRLGSRFEIIEGAKFMISADR